MVSPEHPAHPHPGELAGTPECDQALTTPTRSLPDVAELQALLVMDRALTIERIAALSRDFTSIVDATQLTATDDEHDPEGSTIAFERSQTSALLAAATHHLAEVDEALKRIADDSYGRCERCGEPISPERLLARPAARTCITCATSTDRPPRGRR